MATHKQWGFETRQLHIGQESADKSTNARAVPIYQTSSFVFNDTVHAASLFDLTGEGNLYTRTDNPTNTIFAQRIASLEGGSKGIALASGAAATFYSIFNIVRQGDHIISASTVYGGTYNLFQSFMSQYGIEVTFVNPDDLSSFEKALKENTKAIFIETLGNPNSNIIDIEKVASIAHGHKIPLIVDNTFATPFLLRPFEYGADIVIHSATKFIGGHGTTIGGVIIDSGKFDWEASGKFPQLTEPEKSYHNIRFTEFYGNGEAYINHIQATILRDTGATLSPFNAFLLLQGLETLSLRLERHISNALVIVDYLSNHPKVEKVNHPSLANSPYNRLYKKYFPKGAGSIFSFNIKGSTEQTKKFIDSLQLFSQLANVADSKSLVIHPATTTHSQMSDNDRERVGILGNTVRLSIGTETIDDLIWDLDQALSKI